MQSTDGGLTWSQAKDISLRDGAAKPQLVASSDGWLYVTWESGRGGDLGNVTSPSSAMFAASADGGNTWTAPASLVPATVTNVDEAKNVTVGLDGQGRLVVVWLGLPADQVYYQVSGDQGESWSLPRPIPQVWGRWALFNGNQDGYHMAADSAGDLHLVLAGRTGEAAEAASLIHLTWTGGGWSEPDVIGRWTEAMPEWPRIAVGLGNQLHVVWFLRTGDDLWGAEGSIYSVWYSQGVSTAPPVSPIQLPTATQPDAASPPTATPSSEPPPALTPTAAVSAQPILPAVAGDIHREADELTLVAQSLAPALVIIVLVVISRFLKRR